MIRVLVVEDSPTVRALLVRILSSDPEIEVAGTAANGREAVLLAKSLAPDVITMDVNMPVMGGIEAVTRIMEKSPRPIIIVTAAGDPERARLMFEALEAGALGMLAKPVGPGDPAFDGRARELVHRVKLLSGIKVVARKDILKRGGTGGKLTGTAAMPGPRLARVKVVAIGASIGGPQLLRRILSPLPRDFPVPLLIVQHIIADFLDGMVRWLAEDTGLRLVIPSSGAPLEPGNAYFAPPNRHMGASGKSNILVSKGRPERGLLPSVNYLFRSVGEAFGPAAMGMLLSGMGEDGAEGLLAMRRAGALTIAQDRESAVVYGMPGRAVELGAASSVCTPEEMIETLGKLAR